MAKTKKPTLPPIKQITIVVPKPIKQKMPKMPKMPGKRKGGC